MAKVKLEIDVVIKEALDSIKKVSKGLLKGLNLKKIASGFKTSINKMKKGLTSLKGSFGKLGGSILSTRGLLVGLAGAFAIKKLIGSFSRAISFANQQEDAINALNVAMKVSGSFSRSASKDLQQFASDLQQVSTIGDETTLEMLALGKSFGFTNQGAKKLVKASVELAAATGKDLTTTVENLARTSSGSLGLLARVVPSLKNLSSEALKSGAAIDAVLKQFGGTALGRLDTFSGATTQLSNTFGDLQEEIGFVFTKNPKFIGAIKSLTGFFNNLGVQVKGNRKVLSDTFTNVFKSLIDLTPNVIGALGSVLDFFAHIAEGASIVQQQVLLFISNFSGIDFVETRLKKISDTILLIGIGFAELINFRKQVKTLFTFGNSSKEMKQLESEMENLKGTFKEVKEGFGKTLGNKGFFQSLRDSAKESALEATTRIRKIQELRIQGDKIFKFGADIGSKAVQTVVNSIQKGVDKSKQKIKVDFEIKAGKTGLDKLLEQDLTPPFITPQIETESFDKVISDALQTAAAGGTSLDINGNLKGVKIPDKALEQMSKELESVFTSTLKSLGSGVLEVAKSGGKLLAKNIGKGAEGAKAFLVEGASSVADSFFPGSGAFVAPLVELASMGKEKAKEQITAFTNQIPILIESITEALPVIFETLAKKLPDIIITIVEALPDILIALTKGVVQVAVQLLLKLPEIVGSILTALGDLTLAIGAALIEALSVIFDIIGKAISGAFSNIFDEFRRIPENLAIIFEDFIQSAKDIFNFDGGGKGTSGKVADSIKGVFGFAKGGEIPSGFPNDTFPARLTSGELVVPNDTVGNLKNFINNNKGTNELLSRLIDITSNNSGGGNKNITLEINGEVLSNVILDLNQNNERLTA